MANYSIWLLEYAHVPNQPISSVLNGQHNKGTRELAFSYIALKGEGHNILIDVGTNEEDSYTKKLSKRDNVIDWQPPKEILKKIDMTPEEIDTVILTHAHYDHMDNMDAFPNANFYIQKEELLGWINAAALPKKYDFINLAMNSNNLVTAMEKIKNNSMHFIDGEKNDFLPGISLKPAYNGHTFASQIVIIESNEEKWLAIGDLAYVRKNLTGLEHDGKYIPLGLAVGPQLNIMKTLDEIVELADGKMENIIVGHETDNWDIYPSWKTEDGLHVAEITLAPGERSKDPTKN